MRTETESTITLNGGNDLTQFAHGLAEPQVPSRESLEVDWDYTQLAHAYISRPGYAPAAIDGLVELAGPGALRHVIDLGAGTGHLTAPLAERGAKVLALEPNEAMRRHGMARTSAYPDVRWGVGRMQNTGLSPAQFSLATCGSSFGVADHAATLREVARILEPGGSFACLWNHRDLQDPLQRDIEQYINTQIPGYQYGSRREDQTSFIVASGLFEDVHTVESAIVHLVAKTGWIEAWRSHATLQRQAGPQFNAIVAGIADIVDRSVGNAVEIPYVTRVWVARLRRSGPG